MLSKYPISKIFYFLDMGRHDNAKLPDLCLTCHPGCPNDIYAPPRKRFYGDVLTQNGK